jgi:uncharacterized membrane protein
MSDASLHPPTTNARLEAFCDGVFAIALTLLIIDVRLPPSETVVTSADLWRALGHLTPTIFAFLLSFGVILITWVNHHIALKLVRGSSASFIYANGLLLLTVVFIPFPTSLLAEFLRTDHAAPAVVLYDAVLAVQAIAWVLVSRTALTNDLAADERSAATLRTSGRRGVAAFALYGLLAIAALSLPVTVAILTTVIWAFWLTLSIRLKHA